jgi:uncharacterized protein involved in outer membrane biogenesis
MTRRRKLLILVAATPVLVLAIALLYLNLADLSGWRDTVARLTSDALGRELRINGKFEPDIGFTTRVIATDLTLANADWSDEPQMASVNRLECELDLVSLLFGPITIRDAEITGARVLFEVDDDGRFNWALGKGEPSDGSDGTVELVISRGRLNDIQLIYARPQEETLEAVLSNLEITDDGRGMLDLDLSGTLEEKPVEISGRLGTLIGLINAATVEHDLSGQLGDMEFETAGKIADLRTLGGANLTAELLGPDLALVAETFDLSGLPRDAFEVELEVRAAASGSYFELVASAGEIVTEVSGTVDSLARPAVLDVTVDLSGTDVAAVGTLTGVEGLPSNPFSVSGRVLWSGFPLTCDNVEVRVGDNSLSAHGVVGEPPLMLGTDFTFDGNGPDIASIAALAGLKLPRNSFSVAGRLVRLKDGVNVQGFEARIGRTDLEVDGIVGDPPEYAGTALTVKGSGPNLAHFQELAGTVLPAEPFEIDGKLKEGEGAITLEAVRARLGDTTVEIDGHLRTEAGFAGTDLRIAADSPSASRLAAMANISGIPPETLSIQGRLRVLEQGYRVNDVTAILGDLAVKADGYVGPPPRLTGSDLEIEVEDPDLSHSASIAGITGLPSDPLSIDTRVRVEESGYRLDGFHAVVGDIEAHGDGFVGRPPVLNGTKLAITARGSRIADLGPYLNLPNLPDARFSVAGGLRVVDGLYLLDEIIAEVQDNRATVSGTLSPSENLAGTDLIIEFDGSDLGEVGRLLTNFVELPELPAEPYTLSGQVVIDDSGYELRDVEATLGDARASVTGRLGSPPEYLGSDLRFDIDGPDASLLSAMSRATMPTAPFELDGHVERRAAVYRFHEISARLGEYRAAINGSLGEMPKFIGTDLEIRASGPDANLYETLFGIPDLPDKPFTLDGRFSGTPERFSTQDFKLTFGGSDVEGVFTVDITGKPAVDARLISRVLDLSHLREQLDVAEDATAQRGEAAKETGAKGTLLIPDEPMALAWLQAADAEVAISIEELRLRTNNFRNFTADAHLENGRLEIDRAAASGRGEGRMTGSLLLEPIQGEYRFETNISLRNVRLDPPDAVTQLLQRPPIDIDIDLGAIGATPHELASSTHGAVQLVIGRGVMDSSALDLVTADILFSLIQAFNPFAKEDPTTELECGVALLRFEDGIGKLDPMAFQSDKMTLLGNGKIDLRTEKLNLEWITKPRKGVGISASMITNPYIRLGGTLSDPSLQLKEAEAVVSTGAAIATMGLSLVAKGMFDRITAEKKVCKQALEEIEARTHGSPE